MSRNILCVVEFDKYPEQVVDRAIWLAQLRNCSLHLLVSDPVTDFLGESYVYLLESQHIAESMRNSQDEVLESLVTRAEAAGLQVEADRSSDRHVADLVRREADARQPSYVIKGTHFHDASERASLADADWDLIRALDYPLWFARPVPWQKSPVIVAAVDPVHARDKPAHLDRRIIELARQFADTSDGKLVVVHTYQTIEAIGAKATWAFKPEKLPVVELNQKMFAEHDKALKALGESTGVPAGSLHLVAGPAHEVLPAFVREQGANLLVMGALARSKLRQRIVGSTAARVLDHIPCDVLVARAQQAA